MAVTLRKILSLDLQTDYKFQGCFVLYFSVSKFRASPEKNTGNADCLRWNSTNKNSLYQRRRLWVRPQVKCLVKLYFPWNSFHCSRIILHHLRYSLCCMWKVWNRSSFHLHCKPQILMLVFLTAWNIFFNLISCDMKMLLRILAFNAVDLPSNPSCRNVFAAILIFYLFRKPDILNSHCTSWSLSVKLNVQTQS